MKPTLKRRSVWILAALSILTLSAYMPVWLYTRTRVVNAIAKTRISMGFVAVALAMYCAAFVLGLGQAVFVYDDAHKAAAGLVGLTANSLLLLWCLMLRTRLSDDVLHSGERINLMLTAFFSIFYMQWKINAAIDGARARRRTATAPDAQAAPARLPQPIACVPAEEHTGLEIDSAALPHPSRAKGWALIVQLGVRNVFRSRGKFWLSTFVIAVSCLLLVYATGQIGGVRQTLISGMTDTLTAHIQIKPKAAPIDFFDFASARRLELIQSQDVESILAAVRAVPAVQAAAPRLRYGALVGDDERSVPAMIMAVDPAHEPAVTPDLGTLISPLADPGAALIAPYLAEKLGLAAGGEVLALTDTPDESVNAAPYRLAGLAQAPVLIDEFMNSILLVNLSSARRMLYLEGGATEIAVRVRPGQEARLAEVAAQVEAALTVQQRSYLAVYPYTAVVKSIDNIAGIAAGIGAIQVGTVMLVMLVIVLIVTKMSLHERRAEIGTLISIGMTRARLTFLFLSEVLIKILIGYGAGLVLALLMLEGVRQGGGMRAATAVDQYLYGGKVMYPVIDPGNILLGFVLVLTAALLTTLASCWKAGGQDAVLLLGSKK